MKQTKKKKTIRTFLFQYCFKHSIVSNIPYIQWVSRHLHGCLENVPIWAVFMITLESYSLELVSFGIIFISLKCFVYCKNCMAQRNRIDCEPFIHRYSHQTHAQIELTKREPRHQDFLSSIQCPLLTICLWLVVVG